MTDPTINWCPQFPTVDPYCPVFAPAHPLAVQGAHSLPPACFGAPAPMAAASPASLIVAACVQTLFINCPSLDLVCPSQACPPPPTIINVDCAPPPTSDACPPQTIINCQAHAGALAAHASPDTIMTLPPRCFGAAPPAAPGQQAMAVTMPPFPNGCATAACIVTDGGAHAAAAPHAFDQQPSIPGFFGCPVSIDASCQSPSTVPGVVGCPVIPSAAGGPCVFSVGCHDNHAMALGVTTLPPHCFGAAAGLQAGSPPTKVITGCPAPQVQPPPVRAAATFAAFIDCGPTLGSPCTHPTQAGPACGLALTAPPAATAPPVCAPPTLAGCPQQTLAGCTPTQPPACPPPTLANCQAATAPQTAYFFCIQPSVNFCPPPSNVQCPPVPPTWLACTLHGAVVPPDAGSYSPNTYDPSCGSPPFHPLCMPGFPTSNPPYYTKPSICAPPTLSLACLGQIAAFTPPPPRPTLTDGCPPTQTYQCVFWPTAFPCQ